MTSTYADGIEDAARVAEAEEQRHRRNDIRVACHKVAAAIRTLSPSPSGIEDAVCPDCGGHGEIFGHAPDCDNDSCALAAGLYDCAGQVQPCHCSRQTEALGPTGEPA